MLIVDFKKIGDDVPLNKMFIDRYFVDIYPVLFKEWLAEI